MRSCGWTSLTPAVVAIAAAIATFAASALPPSAANRNLLINGDLATGSGIQPDEWRTEAWINSPEAFGYSWSHPEASRPGELVVNNLKANDGRWMQSLTLEPGWYYLSAEIRTEKIGANEAGASISVMDDGAMSPDIRGTTDWQKAGLYLRVSGGGADIDVALRVGGFGSLNTGRAFFRHASAVKIKAPPPRATPVYDLTELRKSTAPAPIGRPYTMVVTFAILAVAALLGWRMFGEEPLPPGTERSRQDPAERAARR